MFDEASQEWIYMGKGECQFDATGKRCRHTGENGQEERVKRNRKLQADALRDIANGVRKKFVSTFSTRKVHFLAYTLHV